MNDVNVNPSFNKQQNIRELCLKGCSSPSNTQVGGIKLPRKIPTAITYSIYIIAMLAASDNEIPKINYKERSLSLYENYAKRKGSRHFPLKKTKV